MLNFLGIGTQKGGSSWLKVNLMKHPQIYLPCGGDEIHFWDQKRHLGVEWYKGLFAANGGKICGEITPAYSILSPQIIKEIYDINPKMKIIYIIRTPAQRAWSSALMALKRAEMSIEEASDQWFLDHFNSQGSRLRGDYISCLNNWCSVFLREQILVLSYSQISENPSKFMQNCARHLGVDASFFDEGSNNIIQDKVNGGPGYPIRESLIPYLNEIYQEKQEIMEKEGYVF